jgi:hypothetical protein
MESQASKLVILVFPGARTTTILGWLRHLVPAALLIVAAGNLTPPVPSDVVVLDEDEVASGPLSLADALVRRRAASLSSPTATAAASRSFESPGP